MSDKRRQKPKFVDLPPGLQPPDLTVAETAAYRRESVWTTFQKIRTGIYASFLDGRIRIVVFSSVVADRERAMTGATAPPATTKRRRGRPRKPRPEEEQRDGAAEPGQ